MKKKERLQVGLPLAKPECWSPRIEGISADDPLVDPRAAGSTTDSKGSVMGSDMASVTFRTSHTQPQPQKIKVSIRKRVWK